MAGLRKRTPEELAEIAKLSTKQKAGLLLLRAALPLMKAQDIHVPPTKPAPPAANYAQPTKPQIVATGGYKPPSSPTEKFRLENLRVLRTQVLPALRSNFEDDLTEASGLKKFGAVMRAVALLKGAPVHMHGMEEPAPVVSHQGGSPAKPEFMRDVVIGGEPPKKKTGPQQTPAQRRAGLRKRE